LTTPNLLCAKAIEIFGKMLPSVRSGHIKP
jgi:hypothetical protein